MYSLPSVASHFVENIGKAAMRLQLSTHEQWAVDWKDRVLVCRHGVRVDYLSVLTRPADVVCHSITMRHAWEEGR